MGFSNASLFSKLAFILSLVAFAIFVIGFATTYWSTTENIYYAHRGLWHYDTELPSWFQAVQAMECLGLICGLVNLIVLIMYVFVASLGNKRQLLWNMSLATAFLAVVFILVGVVIYGVKYSDFEQLNWSFALAIIGAIMYFVVGIMVFLDRKYIVVS